MDSDSHEFAVRFGERFPWALPLKLLFTAFLGALGGAGLLGYLSEFATYSFAVYYGFRPPVEGIPYLKAAITYGSFFLLLSGAVFFFVATYILRNVVLILDIFLIYLADGKVIESGDIEAAKESLNTFFKESNFRVLLFACFLSLVPVALIFLEFHFGEKFLADPVRAIRLAVFFAIFFFIVGLAIFRQKWVWWMSMVVTSLYFILWVIFLFSPQRYSEFLRLIGYGGGIPIHVELRDPDKSDSYSRKKYYLMLRTTDSLILYAETTGSDIGSEFVEIPRDQVRSLRHDVGGLLNMHSRLPPR